MIKTEKFEDGIIRCAWCSSSEIYIKYHDEEWGYPVENDTRLFEKLCLEGFQAGLSWITILKKREAFRLAFDNFDINKLIHYDETDIDRLLKNEGIVRHRGKIEAVINNAHRAKELIAECGSIAAFVWQFEPQHPENRIPTFIAKSEESTALSKALKKRGWKFVGPTTMYAFMQSMGMVNDHGIECGAYQKSQRLRAEFKRPKLKQ
ncbi:DNA-3-methyladenine glycosylase I [Alteromonas sp. 5E99-2]|uniref:DNA-3-methyladenine glycosylase I n=1 Tax=Alteromonas sp. 5E99-2 TaxID=2817683 RepID=UPI001A9822F4|nr:DNA-3-methyladenine glycosylase I [Alteromonas sp. 5E99-2]MBO1254806.1 DNA-3-methyladenine glycosylase I [Alteromonas sp. 5E99-2]